MLTEILIGLTRGALVIWFVTTALMVISYQGAPPEERPKHWPLGAVIWPVLPLMLLVGLVGAGLEWLVFLVIERCRQRCRRRDG